MDFLISEKLLIFDLIAIVDHDSVVLFTRSPIKIIRSNKSKVNNQLFSCVYSAYESKLTIRMT